MADPTDGQIAVYSIASFAAAFAVHMLAAETWVRLTRGSIAGIAGAVKGA
jgi:hypothetical protein